jgi:hypothetical protein
MKITILKFTKAGFEECDHQELGSEWKEDEDIDQWLKRNGFESVSNDYDVEYNVRRWRRDDPFCSFIEVAQGDNSISLMAAFSWSDSMALDIQLAPLLTLLKTSDYLQRITETNNRAFQHAHGHYPDEPCHLCETFSERGDRKTIEKARAERQAAEQRKQPEKN